jgi:triosephosphate isomerase
VKELNDAAKGQLGGLPQADQVEIVVGPEHIHLSMVLDAIDSRYGVSAQNCWTTSGGAYTGEVRA